MTPRGQISGHAAGRAAAPSAGQPSWGAWIDGLVAEHGSLAAVSERLAALRGHAEDVASIERALRRLRVRGTLPGGKWGDRLLRTFGLPASVDARLRFMGSYHSRFVDLPVPLCTDLVQLWDRPPTSESRAGRVWLSLARVTIAMRERRWAEAADHLATAKAAVGPAAPGVGASGDPSGGGGAPPDAHLAARVEIALAEAHLAARVAPDVLPDALAPVAGWLAALDGEDAHDLRARWAGQVAHAHNRAGRYVDGEAVHAALPDGPEIPAFARARRANGLAYARWRLGDPEAALALARTSARHAGDAGHVRLRAMALLMIARVAPGTEEGRDARERARVIAAMLGDTTLAVRAG